MTDLEQDTLWLGAFRYYLGRQTYAVSEFCELLERKWEMLPASTRNLILREIKQAIDSQRAGGDCDVAAWRRVYAVGVAFADAA